MITSRKQLIKLAKELPPKKFKKKLKETPPIPLPKKAR